MSETRNAEAAGVAGLTRSAQGARTTDGVVVFEPPPPRRRVAPADVLRLVVGIVLVLVGSAVAVGAQETVEGIERDLITAFARLPDSFETFVLSLAQLVTSLVPLVVMVVLVLRRRWRVALLLLATGVMASLLMSAADAVVLDRDLADFFAALEEESTRSSDFPDSRAVASTVAVVIVAAPFLTRRWRRALWWAIGVLVALRLIAIAQPAFDIVLALGVGTTVGAAVLVAFGSPSREPGPRELLDALRADGFDPKRIDRPVQVDGDSALRFGFVDRADAPYEITLRTPDDRDADVLARAYRSLRFRASEVGTAFASPQRRIEHEALVLSLAHGAGVHTVGLERIGTTGGGSAYIVTRPVPGRAATADDLGDAMVLADLWRQVGALHDAGVAHRSLSVEAVTIDADGRPVLVGFDGARIAPNEREIARDVAELLTETAVAVGPEEAVRAAVDALGPGHVAPAMRMLQPLALPPSTRKRAKEVDGLLDALRDEVNRATGEPEPELEELERIRPRTLLIIGASSLAFYSLLPQLANLEDTIDAFGSAEPLWILAAAVASAGTYLFAAISFRGAVADPVPFAATFRAKVASSFAGLVGPAGAGGFALTARYLERVGVRPAEAGASVAVDAIGGLAVHLALMGGFFLWAGNANVGGFSLPDSHTVLLVLAVLLAVIGVAAAIGPVRQKVLVPLVASLRSGLGQVGRVFQSPARVAGLFGGSIGLTLTYVLAVFASIEAYGGGLTLAQTGAAYLGAVAIATLAPTPGGLGALESAMIAGFVGFGLDDGTAVSATLTFRLATFWLPILPGWLTLGWMQRNGEL